MTLGNIDESCGDERRPGCGVADRADKPVVLVAEVGGDQRVIGKDATSKHRWNRRQPERIGDEHTPMIVGVREVLIEKRWRRMKVDTTGSLNDRMCERGVDSALEAHRTGAHHCVEDMLVRRPEPLDRCLPQHARPNRPSVSRREQRHRQHQTDPATVGAGETQGQRQKIGRRIGVGSAAKC